MIIPSSRILLPVLVLAAFVGTAPAGAQLVTITDTSRTVVSASGVARVQSTPDRASITILVEPQAMSVEEAGTRLGAVERQVLDTLRRMGIPGSAIQTFNSGVGPYRNNMGSSLGGGPQFSGRSMIRIELPRLDQVPAIPGAALAKGATAVMPPSYSMSTADSVRRTLIPQAFAQARREAEVLAAAAGGRLGRLLDVSVNQNFSSDGRSPESMYLNYSMFDNGQRIAPSTPLTVTVVTRWVLVR